VSNLFPTSNLTNTNNSQQIVDRQETKQFLKFAIYPSTKLMLPIKQITEVLKIQFGQIVPIPQMPAWVMGVYNWRGDILWMVDLGHLIGLDPWYQRENHRNHQTAIVLSPNQAKAQAQSNREVGTSLGLIVSHVEDLKMCEPSAIQSPPNNSVNGQIISFAQGYWLEIEDDDMTLVLDGKAIVAAMPKNLSSQ